MEDNKEIYDSIDDINELNFEDVDLSIDELDELIDSILIDRKNIEIDYTISESDSDDLLATYLKEISRYNTLSQEDEISMFTKRNDILNLIESAKELKRNTKEPHEEEILNDRIKELNKSLKKITDDIANANLKLVVYVAKKYHNNNIDKIDLVSEGNIGLLNSIDKFDVTKGYRFATYAYFWIKQAISRSIANKSNMVRIPAHVLSELYNYLKDKKEYINKYGVVPSPSDMIKEYKSKYTLKSINKMERQLSMNDFVSLDTPIGEDGDNTIQDFVEDTFTKTPEDYIKDQAIKEEIDYQVSTLDEKEEMVIRLRYGIGVEYPLSLKEISDKLDVNEERVRILERTALRKLRHPEKIRNLRKLIKD